MIMENIDKSKLVLINNEDSIKQDKPLETKQVGYYRDVWNRFCKNRVSLVAFIIICILFFFVLFGPLMKKEHNILKKNEALRNEFRLLAPKSKLFSWMGINGKVNLQLNTKIIAEMYANDYGKTVFVNPEKNKLLQRFLNDPEDDYFVDRDLIKVHIDEYRFLEYQKSYAPTGTYEITLNQEEYNKALNDGLIVRVLSVNDGYLRVNVKFFEYFLGQTPDDTYFWFGTTTSGKDLFLALWSGARVSLLIALSVVIINAAIGLILGAISGYYGGVFDLIFGRFVEILSGIPFLAVLTLLILRFGEPVWVIIIAFTLTGWIGSYGMARMQFYRFKNREYILAARSLGANDARIMGKHIFPNAIGYMLTSFALAIPSFVFSEASYSYLKIINYKNVTSVGMLLQQGQGILTNGYVFPLLYPAIYIAILMITFNLFGNGLRDAFNPSLRGSE